MPKSKTYEEFVEKFKPKKTTDDCYTPPGVYGVVRDWACERYGIEPGKIVRPFYPGGDYERFDYPEGAVVLDNPPFSILTKICTFYLDRKIPFFLFAPSLTCFAGTKIFDRMCHLVCDCDVEYENGAVVKTSFVTSYEQGVAAKTEPELTRLVNEEVERERREKTKTPPKYIYPDHVVTAALMQKYAKRGVDFAVRQHECQLIGRMDSQRESGKVIYGHGLLLNDDAARRHAAAERAAAERAAAERAAAERAAAKVWELSDREKKLVADMSRRTE